MNHFTVILGRITLTLCTTLLVINAEAAGFSGPLFGLATAPNGDLLIADAGAGVVIQDSKSHSLPPLPGITDISAIGKSALWVTANGTDPASDTGQGLYRMSNGKVSLVADLFAFELANDPHPAVNLESNPFDVQALDGETALVADAAANDLLRVNKDGLVEVLAIFPDALVSTDNIKSLVGCPAGPPDLCNLPAVMPAQAVPTSIAIGADGWYYVGELKGFPAPTDASRIWRVAPWASWADCGNSPDCEVVFDGGFTSIIDLAFGPDGLLYVVELDEASWFAPEALMSATSGTINACDVGTLYCSEAASGLVLPTAITFGKDGTLWSTVFALVPPFAAVISIP
ncbi:MAG: ScyD/ScyE family protein [Lysobacterales bacterium]